MAKFIVGDPAACTTTPTAPTAPPSCSGIIFRVNEWQWTYTGPRGALTAAGVVPPEAPFPGDRPGRPQCRFTAPHERRASITRAGEGLFCVTIFTSAADRESCDARMALTAAAAEEAAARADLAILPKTHEDFRHRAADMLWSLVNVYRNTYGPNHESGFRFSTKTVDEFNAAASRLYYVLKNGETIFDASQRDRRIIAARLKGARANNPLQQMLKRAAEVANADGST